MKLIWQLNDVLHLLMKNISEQELSRRIGSYLSLAPMLLSSCGWFDCSFELTQWTGIGCFHLLGWYSVWGGYAFS